MSVTYRYEGIDDIRKMLKQYAHPILTKRMKSATKAGGKEIKKPLKSAAGAVSKRMGKAVSVVQNPRPLAGRLPSTRDPHVYVGFRKKVAPFAHMVIGGTRDHGPRKAPVMIFKNPPRGVRAMHVRGVTPNPIVSRVAASHGDRAYGAAWRDLDKTEHL